MQWNNAHRERLYHIIERRWSDLELDPWEEWLASLGIKWAELYHENDAPQGTVAVHEGPGIEDKDLRMCWVIPEDIALKLLTLNIP
jgi:hypothetical protein